MSPDHQSRNIPGNKGNGQLTPQEIAKLESRRGRFAELSQGVEILTDEQRMEFIKWLTSEEGEYKINEFNAGPIDPSLEKLMKQLEGL